MEEWRRLLFPLTAAFLRVLAEVMVEVGTGACDLGAAAALRLLLFFEVVLVGVAQFNATGFYY